MATQTVRVDRDGKAKVGRRTLTFPGSLAGATVTVDVKPAKDEDKSEE